MANVKDYASEKVLKDVKLTLYSLKLIKIPVLGPLLRTELFKRIKNFEPKIIKIKCLKRYPTHPAPLTSNDFCLTDPNIFC